MRCLLLIVAVAWLLPLQAQLKIDQTPEYEEFPEFKLPGLEPAKQAEKPDATTRPVYTGDPARVGIVCDPDALLQAGLSCSTASPCDLELELMLAEEVGERILVAGSVRTAAGTLESVLLVSSDGGGSWIESADRVAGGALETAQFVDDEIGWVGGQSSVDGAVSEPFLMFTKDGGEEFDPRLILAGGEAQEGYILQLQFDSADHGYVILEKANAAADPFTLYETYNGGRSWAIRQIVAERPAIPGARRRQRTVLDSNLRLGAHDGVIELERRSGADWARVAGFQAELGSCPLETGPTETP